MNVVVLGIALAASAAEVTVPLAVWEERVASSVATSPAEGAVTLGSARWVGSADPETGALTLDATLQVSLHGPGRKEVPLIDADAVLLSVEVDGRPVAVGRAGASHAWPTDLQGDHAVRVRAIVPPSGQRGAVEYDFGVPRTAATRLELTLPKPDLRPEVTAAVRSVAETVGQTTRLVADLAPTDRVRLVGLRDLGAADARDARLYAETAHLVAVDESRVELFTVVRYNILYAGARRFEVFVPDGLSVVSADGEGAFAWELVPTDGGSLLRGETAWPIRNRYEVSLRLARDLPTEATRLELPHVVGVEREHGWVGLEAPGRVRIEAVAPEDLQRVEVHQLPDELRAAAVSPLLQGFRSHGDGALRVTAVPLPEVEVEAERLDAVEAHTVVSATGRAVTELSLTLRNRLRSGLVLDLPEGGVVTRALLDGEPVVPSRDVDGGVVLPLRRSESPMVLQVVVEAPVDVPGWWGRTELSLPSLDLPASAVRWTVELPQGWSWSELDGDVASMTQVGSGRWLAAAPPAAGVAGDLVAASDGTVREYARYWVPANAVVEVSAGHTAPTLERAGRVAGWLAGAVVAWFVGGRAAWRWASGLVRGMGERASAIVGRPGSKGAA